ncbi:hypothetical protein KBD09_02385 [Candidatus Woesebacteria bacterium]|nr:hypothetical protein [Candidatus Woesebacteria bacterium]
MNPAINVEQIIREYLPGIIHLSLATVRDNTPWVCEVHYAYDDELNLYFRSLTSRRHSQEIAINSKVAGNIVKQHSLEDIPVGVYFEGTALMLDNEDEMAIACACIKEILGYKGNMIAEAKQDDGHKIYKITVENWYVFGRFGLPRGQKHKLEWNGGKK